MSHSPSPSPYHGTGVALGVDRDGPLVGVLLHGPSGAGKSDLAIRLIETCPWRRSRLVADDAVLLSRNNDALVMGGATALHGKIEARHFGIVSTHGIPYHRLDFCVALDSPVSRMPEIQRISPLEDGTVDIPLVVLDPFTASAPHKLRMIARRIILTALSCHPGAPQHSDQTTGQKRP